MDRKKEEQEQQQLQEEQPPEKSTKPILTPLITSTNILTATDDDASTESSDTFETWTLVSDKQNRNKPVVEGDDIVNRIEILKNSEADDEVEEDEEEENGPEENVEEQQLKDSLNDITNEDFSDGISIISESESVGRVSPHPYLRDHLHDLNFKFATNENIGDDILNKFLLKDEIPLVLQHPEPEQQIRQRRQSSSSATPPREEQALQKSSQTLSIAREFPTFVKRGLQGLFYVCLGLAILGLIGKIVNPTWQPLANVVNPSSANNGELEQKVNDMELQNNLMRAEIDILNKQVKYLSTLNDGGQQQYQQKGKYNKDYKEGKTFKAWSGNGDSLKPVDITKEDLKRPYKCPDGSYVEIANMCMEQRPHDPSIVDQFGQVVEDLKQQSEAFKTFEEVAEELQGFQDNPFEHLEKVLGEGKPMQQQSNEFIKNKPVYQSPEDLKQQQLPKRDFQSTNPPPYKKQKYDKSPGKYEDSSIPTRATDRKQFGKEFNTENKKFHDSRPSREKFNKFRDNIQEKFEKFRDNSKEKLEKFRDNSIEKLEKFIDSSKEKLERFKENSKLHRDNSKERKSRKLDDDSKESEENNSKEYNNKQKRKFDKDNSGDDDADDSGEWQEKYMKHRENQRKQNEQNYQENKNWYIKRGNSREYKRSAEKYKSR